MVRANNIGSIILIQSSVMDTGFNTRRDINTHSLDIRKD